MIDCRKQDNQAIERALMPTSLTVYTLIFKKNNGELKMISMNLNKESLYIEAALLEKEEEYKDGKFIIIQGR